MAKRLRYSFSRNAPLFVQTLLFFFLFSAVFPQQTTAQVISRASYNWYFGTRAALSWNNPEIEVEALYDSDLNGSRGSVSMSDRDGNLLFYGGSWWIYNRDHEMMPNGQIARLLPLPTFSVQSVLTIPFPGDQDERFYYVFHWESGENGNVYSPVGDSLFYSVVDMEADGGRGDLVSKHNFVGKNLIGKFIATRHSNGKDVWLFTHRANSNQYLSFLINEQGVALFPVVSSSELTIPPDTPPAGFVDVFNVTYGCMYCSPNGKDLVLDYKYGEPDFTKCAIERSKINTATGQISNCYQFNTYENSINDLISGMGFSPNSKMFYVTLMNELSANNYPSWLLQYDLSLPESMQVASEFVVCYNPESTVFGHVTAAPDGKMYTGWYLQDSLHVIHNPNLKKGACGFEKNALSLVTNDGVSRSFRNSFPQFIQSYFDFPDFLWENTCLEEATHFWLPNPSGIDSVLWYFNDPAQPGATSKIWEPYFTFSATGDYEVELNYYYTDEQSIVRVNEAIQTVTIYEVPQVYTLGSSQTLCQGESGSLTLSGSQNDVNYILWRSGTDSITFLYGNGNPLIFSDINQSGTYSVEAIHTIGGCTNSMLGSPVITIAANPQQYNFAQTAEICQGESCTLSLPGSELGTSYFLIKNLATIQTLVGNGSALDFDNITETGNYTVEAESTEGCTATMAGTATVTVGVSPQKYTLSGGGKICQGFSLDLTLSGSETNTSYTLFKNGVATTTTLPGTGLQLIFENISTSGTYTIEAQNNSSSCKTEMDGTAVIEVAARPKANAIRFH